MSTSSDGFSQIGKYGTMMLMRKGSETPVTSFGIDDKELTFGRDTTCSVRLYYPEISGIHCKISFNDENKAFLAVLGSHGLKLDGEELLPPTTTPVFNESEIEIHGKRFKFAYPPKEMRPVLYASPTKSNRRKLRLSMIQSAQVFSPRPSKDPRENLRVLQSPLKPFQSRSSRSNASSKSDDDGIVLVDGSNPQVTQSEKDLVILEDIEIKHTSQAEAPATPSPPPLKGRPSQSLKEAVSTPQRRPPRPSLHRAVLIRSAQRAIMKHEQEEGEEEEMEEVFGYIPSPINHRESGGSSEGDEDRTDVEMEENKDASLAEVAAKPEQKSSWRKSLGSLWPFSRASAEPEVPSPQSSQSPASQVSSEDQMDEDKEEFSAIPELQTPRRVPAPANRFMTPQLQSKKSVPTRISLGGDLPRRVVAEPQTWKINDIVIPSPDKHGSVGHGRPSLSEAERKAITERRRSALIAPSAFFGPNGVPGISETPRRTSLSPVKGRGVVDLSEVPEEQERANLDQRTLLERMKEAVEDTKRRRSCQPSSPVKPYQSVKDDMDLDEHFTTEEVEHAFEKEMADGALLSTLGENGQRAQAPATPSFRGMRQMFSQPKADAPMTPALKGMRQLFKIEKEHGGLSTPILEGVEDMMQEPDGWNEPHVEENEKEERVPQSRLRQSKRRTVAKEAPSLADDESSLATKEVETEMDDVPREENRKKGRILKGRGLKDPNDAESVDKSNTQEGQEKSRRGGLRSKTPQLSGGDEDQDPAPKVRRGRKPKTTTEDDEMESIKPVRRVRTKTASSGDVSDKEAPKSAKSRKPVSKSKHVEEAIDVDELDVIGEDQGESEPRKLRTARAKTKVKQEEEDEGLITKKRLPSSRKKVVEDAVYPEKENAPSEEAEVKVKVTRSRKGTTRAKDDAQSDLELPTRTRLTRSRAAKT